MPALLTVLVTVAAIVPDQSGQFLWITRGVRLAQEAARTGDSTHYLRFEAATFRLVAAWGCAGYLSGALGWTWCLAAAGTWSRRLTWLSVATWGVFAISTAILFLPPGFKPGSTLAAAGNAVAFVLLQLWFIAVIERVAARSRVPTGHGRYAAWRAPRAGFVSSTTNWIANSHSARALAGLSGPPALVSQIRDVVYINYLVEAARLKSLTPSPLELQTLGPSGQWAMLTVLTYNHGHFGPRALGPFRRFAPSPVQSNWRIYVIDPDTGRRGVYFITTAISSVFYALVARHVSEGMPMHVPRSTVARRSADGGFHLLLDPGAGTSPDLRAELRPTDRAGLPLPWSECFGNFREMLAYCVPQDRALAPQPWYSRIARQEIELGIPLDVCRPIDGRVESNTLRAIVGSAEPVCFHVPEVLFRFHREHYDRWRQAPI